MHTLVVTLRWIIMVISGFVSIGTLVGFLLGNVTGKELAYGGSVWLTIFLITMYFEVKRSNSKDAAGVKVR